MENNQNQLAVIEAYGKSQEIIERFSEVVGKDAAGSYVRSALLAVAQSPALLLCTPQSIFASAERAATIQLYCDPSLGHAYLVPFKNKNGGSIATLIIGYKGLYQLALRTRQYRYIDVCPIFEGEGIDEGRMTGKMTITGGKQSQKIIGWIGGFRLVNGFEKFMYMTIGEIHDHAKRYSKGYNRPDGAWKTNTQEMEKKTVLRLLLSRYGYLDPKAMSVVSSDADSDGVELNDDFPEVNDVHTQEPTKIIIPENDWMDPDSEDVIEGKMTNVEESKPESEPSKPAEYPGDETFLSSFTSDVSELFTLDRAVQFKDPSGISYAEYSTDRLWETRNKCNDALPNTKNATKQIELREKLNAVDRILLDRKAQLPK